MFDWITNRTYNTEFLVYRRKHYFFYDKLPLKDDDLVQLIINLERDSPLKFVTSARVAKRIWYALHKARYKDSGELDRKGLYSEKEVIIKESGQYSCRIYDIASLEVITFDGFLFKSFPKYIAVKLDDVLKDSAK